MSPERTDTIGPDRRDGQNYVEILMYKRAEMQNAESRMPGTHNSNPIATDILH